MSEREPTDPEAPGADGTSDDELDELDARVLEDLDADEDAEEVRGGSPAFTDDCVNRN